MVSSSLSPFMHKDPVSFPVLPQISIPHSALSPVVSVQETISSIIIMYHGLSLLIFLSNSHDDDEQQRTYDRSLVLCFVSQMKLKGKDDYSPNINIGQNH